MIKLYDLLMSLSYDWLSNPMKLNAKDYEDNNVEGKLKTPALPFRLDSHYNWLLLPGNIEERKAYIEKELIDCEVKTVIVHISPQEDGSMIPVVEIFTQ